MIRAIAVAALLALAAPAAAVPAPKVAIAGFGELKTPLPLPYDEAADADALLVSATARARASGRRLLIDMGGNWCPDCRIVAGVMERPEVKRFIDRHFVLVMIDVGRFDRNQHIVRRYGLEKLTGVPALLVVDPRTDRLMNAGKIETLSNARAMSPQAIVDWIAGWAR